MCFMKSSDRLQLYTEEDVKNNVVVAPGIVGDFVFTYNAPPPPPHEPTGGSCYRYVHTPYADLGNAGYTDPNMGMTVVATDFLSTCYALHCLPPAPFLKTCH